MQIGNRLRELREEKKLTQADMEKRTGLVGPYISRIENNHNVPTIETLEKFAKALEVPVYQFFYDGEKPPKVPNLPQRNTSGDKLWGSLGKDALYLKKLRRQLGKANEKDRKIIMVLAQNMARR
jgi:transcriptional regulator with XRE-family HTH domain